MAGTNAEHSTSTYDGGNTIIVFSNTFGHEFQGASSILHPDLKKRWTEVLAEIARTPDEVNDLIVTAGIDLVLESVFKIIVSHWDHLLGICATHVNILEDKGTKSNKTYHPELILCNHSD